MEYTNNLLCENNLKHLISVFEENKLSVALLKDLEDNDLTATFKELNIKIGERLQLITIIRNEKRKSQRDDGITGDSIMPIPQNLDNDIDMLNQSTRGEPIKTFVNTGGSSSSTCENPTKKIKLAILNLYGNHPNMKTFLESQMVGRAILLKYSFRNNLNSIDRQKLVHLLVDFLMSIHNSITSDSFKAVAEEIVENFPTEITETYYVSMYNGKRKVTSGKLVDRYRNQKHFFRSCALASEIVSPSIVPSLEITEKITFLKYSVEPWNNVVSHWEDTYDYRKESETKQATEESVLEQWPSLKHEKGYNLVRVLQSVINVQYD